jgi:hypothetical protein
MTATSSLTAASLAPGRSVVFRNANAPGQSRGGLVAMREPPYRRAVLIL